MKGPTPGREPFHCGAGVDNLFFKGHGLGNDYIALNPAKIYFRLTQQTIRALCDRHWGVGGWRNSGSQPLPKKADFGLRIYNPDGSEAEKSGNGLRIFGCYLYHTKYTKKNTLRWKRKAAWSKFIWNSMAMAS